MLDSQNVRTPGFVAHRSPLRLGAAGGIGSLRGICTDPLRLLFPACVAVSHAAKRGFVATHYLGKIKLKQT